MKMKHLFKVILSGFDRLTGALSWIVNIGIVSLVLVTFVDVTGRYCFNAPLLGSLELTEISMATIGGFAIMWTNTQKGHILVDVVSSKFPRRVQTIIGVIGSLLGFVVWGIIAYQSFLEGVQMLKVDQHTALLYIKIAPFQIILAAGLVLYCLTLIRQLAQDTKPKDIEGGPVI